MPAAIYRVPISEARATIRSAAARVREYDGAGLVGEVDTDRVLELARNRGARATMFLGAGRDGFDQIVIQPFPGKRGEPVRFVVDLARIGGELSAVTPGERAADLHADCPRCAGKLNPSSCRAIAA
jgi:hypothetical protein